MSALTYIGLFCTIIVVIGIVGLAIAWCMKPPTALDDELSAVDDAVKLRETERNNRHQQNPSPF